MDLSQPHPQSPAKGNSSRFAPLNNIIPDNFSAHHSQAGGPQVLAFPQNYPIISAQAFNLNV